MTDLICFLDYDGVISSPRAQVATGWWIDPIATTLLRKLHGEFGFKIVVSSTWRLFETRARDVLKQAQLYEALHKDWRTNESPDGSRPAEIDDWLRRNGEPEFFILDDDGFAWTGRQHARWVKTDAENGILLHHYDQARKLIAQIREGSL